MRTILSALLLFIYLSVSVSQSVAFEYQWEIDETPEGLESVTVVEPVHVTILDEQFEISPHSASIWLMKRYSVHIGTEWSGAHAYKLLQTFESIPQHRNHPVSFWKLSDRHIDDDIEIVFQGDTMIVTVAEEAFTYAKPLLAEIEGVRGRFFSKRLHRAVVRFVTDNGEDRDAIERILKERFAVSVNVPDYKKLTQFTTWEDADRFMEFKNDELLAIVSMFEEYPQGMLKTPGLKYLVRRLDGTEHPRYPQAAAVAWVTAEYIEFMESAFKGAGYDYIHRLILHEKAHFLWAHLFDEQLKQDWIELGGWYRNPDDVNGWSTTKQTEFVSAYAHGINPDEDMAESISFYIVRPDKLRSRAPAKYEFIQNRIMHGTRYISQIREDLTFEVYNLYPDYIYPGRIIRTAIQVEGEPEEDKQITIELEIHREGELDSATGTYIRVYSKKDTYFEVFLVPIDSQGKRIRVGHVFRGHAKLSRFAPNGYWAPDSISLSDVHGNERHGSQTDYGWKLYIDNPLEDCEAPKYVPNSMQLSLSKATTSEGKPYQVLTASWEVIEKSGMGSVDAALNDTFRETHSKFNYGGYDIKIDRAVVKFNFPEYMPSSVYSLNHVGMRDIALNRSRVYFTDSPKDEAPQTIEIKTENPDYEPPVLDVNRITIKAEPTIPEEPNGETVVDISFWIKDNISGYNLASMDLRDPHGVNHNFWHYPDGYEEMYFPGDPTIFKEYHQRIVLPVGSVPGTWGLAYMGVRDKAGNSLRLNFTEIVRFKVDDGAVYSKSDVNEDGEINILDLVLVASFDASNERADVNGDGTVNILDIVAVASHFNEEGIAAPPTNTINADQIQNLLTQAIKANDGSAAFRRGIRGLQNLLLSLHPEKTALLPNYPNPFNPETWIPYHLANASVVQITIYDMRGSIIRTLVLGHRAAGYYTDRDRAAYWDGRNGSGERTASGIYYYRLQADKVSLLRKMVILK